MGNEVCPKCGSKGKLEEGSNYWHCGSHDRRGFFYQSDLCESRESLAEKDARIAALAVELERVKGENERLRTGISDLANKCRAEATDWSSANGECLHGVIAMACSLLEFEASEPEQEVPSLIQDLAKQLSEQFRKNGQFDTRMP